MLFWKIIIRHLFCYTIKWNSYIWKWTLNMIHYPTAVYTDSVLLFWFFCQVHLFDRFDVFRPESSVSLIGQSRDNTSGSPCVVCRQTDRRTDRWTDNKASASSSRATPLIIVLHSNITLSRVESKSCTNFYRMASMDLIVAFKYLSNCC